VDGSARLRTAIKIAVRKELFCVRSGLLEMNSTFAEIDWSSMRAAAESLFGGTMVRLRKHQVSYFNDKPAMIQGETYA
jgi:hypothetical protein